MAITMKGPMVAMRSRMDSRVSRTTRGIDSLPGREGYSRTAELRPTAMSAAVRAAAVEAAAGATAANRRAGRGRKRGAAALHDGRATRFRNPLVGLDVDRR